VERVSRNGEIVAVARTNEDVCAALSDQSVDCVDVAPPEGEPLTVDGDVASGKRLRIVSGDVFGYGEESARVAYMAGWCHDAGYAFAPTQLDHAEAGGVILSDAGASFADAVCSHGDPDVLAMSDLLLIVNTADMMCGPDGVPVSFDERLSDVEARYGVGSRQAVDVGMMLSVLRRELELRGVSVEAAERAGVERADAEAVEDAVDSGAEGAENASVVADGAEGVSAADVDAADAVDSP